MKPAGPFIVAIAGSAALLGCAESGPITLDIVEVGPARFASAGPPAGHDGVAVEVDVLAGQLAAALDRGAAFELTIVDCAAPDIRKATSLLTLGGTPVNDVHSSQVSSDDPDTQVLLSGSVARVALESGRPCGRLVPIGSGPELTSRPVPLRR